jgi:hypothetical protein
MQKVLILIAAFILSIVAFAQKKMDKKIDKMDSKMDHKMA